MDTKDAQFELTHQSILDAGQLLFQEKGYRGTSLRDVMGKAGLTVGGFYAHFDSKSQLFQACFERGSMAGAQRLFAGPPAAGFRKSVEKYLSPGHIANKSRGCPLAALISELDQFQKEHSVPMIDEYVKKVTGELIAQGSETELSLALVSMMVGALALARCVQGKELKERIISQALKSLDLFAKKEPTGEGA